MSSRDHALDATQEIISIENLLKSVPGLINQAIVDYDNNHNKKGREKLTDISKAITTAAVQLQKSRTVVNHEQSSSLAIAVNAIQVHKQRDKRQQLGVGNATERNDRYVVRDYHAKHKSNFNNNKNKNNNKENNNNNNINNRKRPALAALTSFSPPISPIKRRTRTSNDNVGVTTRYKGPPTKPADLDIPTPPPPQDGKYYRPTEACAILMTIGTGVDDTTKETRSLRKSTKTVLDI